MKKNIIVLLLALVCFACSCTKTYKDIKVTSFDIISITPKGLHAVDAVVDVGLDNPIMGFDVTAAKGVLKMDGRECLIVTAPEFSIEGHAQKVYRVSLQGTLSPGFNPLELLTIAKDMDFSKFSLDAKAHVGLLGGIGKDIDVKDIKLDKFLGGTVGNILPSHE